MLKILNLRNYRRLIARCGSFLWSIVWLFGGGTLAVFCLRWWPGERLIAVRLFNYFMPWLLLGLAPGALTALFWKRSRLAATLGLSTAVIGLTYIPLFLPRPNAASAAGTPLKVMSYNILYRNMTIPKAIDLIRREQPDILLLQEITPTIAESLQAGLVDLYGEADTYLRYERDIGQFVVSRYPIEPVTVSSKAGRVQKVVIITPDGPLNVWNVHPKAPVAWSLQRRQVIRLVQDIAEMHEPLIVGGDFNTTDQAEAYGLVNQYLHNAHWDAGWGFGFTFPAYASIINGLPVVKPMVRIDHIFYSDHFYVWRARTLADSGGSDHFPVVAELSLVR